MFAAHDLLSELSREHESCCGQAVYALELAADDLAIVLPRSNQSGSVLLPAVEVGDRLRLVIRLLQHLLTMAISDDEEAAIIAALYFTSCTYLDH